MRWIWTIDAARVTSRLVNGLPEHVVEHLVRRVQLLQAKVWWEAVRSTRRVSGGLVGGRVLRRGTGRGGRRHRTPRRPAARAVAGHRRTQGTTTRRRRRPSPPPEAKLAEWNTYYDQRAPSSSRSSTKLREYLAGYALRDATTLWPRRRLGCVVWAFGQDVIFYG